MQQFLFKKQTVMMFLVKEIQAASKLIEGMIL